MKSKLLIGEMSKLLNVPKKTLRYYDEIGLFRPAEINKQTGYRYYSFEQFQDLENIKYMTLLGISLKEIKAMLQQRDLEGFLELLDRQKETIVQKIDELELIKQRVLKRKTEIEDALRASVEVVSIKKFPERQIISLKGIIRSELELEMSLRELCKLALDPRVFIGKVGLTVSESNLRAKNFHEYSSIHIIVEDPDDHRGSVELETLPAGEYACVFFRGSHTYSDTYYKALLDHIERQDYVITGESLERIIIDHSISKDEINFLTEIRIPVEKANK